MAGPLFLQEPLVWWSPTPQPWVEQNPPMAQRFFTAAWKVLMVRVCWLGIFWSRAAASVLGEADRGFRFLSSLVMVSYCLVVADVRCALALVS